MSVNSVDISNPVDIDRKDALTTTLPPQPPKRRGRPAECLDTFFHSLLQASGRQWDPTPPKRGRPAESLDYLTERCQAIILQSMQSTSKPITWDPSPRKRGRPAESLDYLIERCHGLKNMIPSKRGRPCKNLVILDESGVPVAKTSKTTTVAPEPSLVVHPQEITRVKN